MFLVKEQIDSSTGEGKLRIATAATALVPAIAIYAMGYKFDKMRRTRFRAIGSPPGWFFAIAWGLAVLLWAWFTIVTAFYAEWQWVAGFLVLHVFCAVAAAYWPYAFQVVGMASSVQTMGIFLFLTLLILLFALMAPLTNTPDSENAKEDANNARAALGFSWGPIVAWAIFATMLAFVSANVNGIVA